ncbi:NAD(P)-binding domain-containing protein [Novosphingobium sp. MMS21-SN21R]|uniref:NAD(P)-dependent oxidoreductase n=1 Tax=Novosphingobium sp. MMS21-SN21R TaxID=2969298 RepID=UPI0028837657|nr:NAD(P)-binding domain-containing protein [Novosphingobium sp. MMS21-SN21R]MDT0509715.1 NAD(P)-binding domain-containing protein [Novosphingobium sp. MMS21-SN21R]
MGQDIGSVGFIGLGSMGGCQARELAKLALPLTVFDKFPAAMEPFRGRATLAGSIADLGNCDVVGICVQDDKQVTECCDELIPAMKPGSVILVHSTIRPATAQALAERAAAVGVELMDAAVTRTEMGNDGPFVFCMLGGSEATMARVQPVLDAYSTNTMLVGPLGSAMGLKICNNLVSWSQIMLGLEAMDLAEAAGVPIDKLMTVMQRNGVMTPPMNGFIAFRNNPGEQSRRDLMAVQAGIGEKDLTLADELGEAVGRPSAIGANVKTYVKQFILDVCRR